MPTRSSKLRARFTASWPVSESATSRISCGDDTFLMSAISAISGSSMWVRPAVSRMTTSCPPSLPACTARLAMSTGVCPATIGRVATFTCSPSWRSCSCAAGRRVSSDAIRTFLPWRSVSLLAILAVVVVLPEPCRPTIMTTTGAGALRSIALPSWPSMSTSSSWTILTTIWPGLIDFSTAAPTALSRTLSVNERTTSSATSASISARRTSRRAAETSASDSAPRPVRPFRIEPRRSCSDSNIRLPHSRSVPTGR